MNILLKNFLTIIGILIAIPALSQIDSMSVVVTKQRTAIKILPIKLRATVRNEISMGMADVYVPETDLPDGNRLSKAHILVYQIPMTVQTTQAQLDSITKYIKRITEPSTIPKPDLVTYIDDQGAPNNVYTTGWTSLKNQPWQILHVGNSTSFTGNTGTSSVKVTFDGYRFEWIAEKRINHGIASIKVDNLPAVEIDLYSVSTANESSVVYMSPDLGSGNHTVTISMTGRKNVAATEANIIHDAIRVYKKQ